jgi:hypothetical protein
VSYYIPAKRKLTHKIIPHELGLSGKYNLGYQMGAASDPKLPDIPETPAAPTIDTAQQDRSQQDRLRRRRGVLANIYAGQTTGGGGGGATQLGA